jgi:hypothetical protein
MRAEYLSYREYPTNKRLSEQRIFLRSKDLSIVINQESEKLSMVAFNKADLPPISSPSGLHAASRSGPVLRGLDELTDAESASESGGFVVALPHPMMMI